MDASTVNNTSLQSITDLVNVARFDYTVGISTGLCVAGLVSNLLVLAAYSRNLRQCHPSDLYVINLLTANIVNFVFFEPFEVYSKLHTTWQLGSIVCTIYMYIFWGAPLLQVGAHFLIALNRLWALWLPMSFRQSHTHKLALIICAAMWIVMQPFILPGIIADVMYYRRSEELYGCFITIAGIPGQETWLFIGQTAGVVLLLGMMVSFPLVWCRMKDRLKIHTNPESTKSTTERNQGTRMARLMERQSFRLQALLTVSVLIFWGPSTFYFYLQPFAQYYNQQTEYAVVVLYNCQGVIDPLLFTLTFNSVRRNVRDLLRCTWFT